MNGMQHLQIYNNVSFILSFLEFANQSDNRKFIDW